MEEQTPEQIQKQMKEETENYLNKGRLNKLW